MHTWNTIKQRNTGKFTKALFLLETLCHDLSIPIIEYLRQHHHASFLELSLALTLDSATLEEQLEKLCGTGVVCQEEAILGNGYVLDSKRMQAINAIAEKLADRK